MDIVDVLEASLRGHGIDVETIESGSDGLEVRYTTAFPDIHVNRQEVGRLLQGLMEAFETTAAEPMDVEAAVYRSAGDRQGHWRVAGADMAAYMQYKIDGTELTARVLDSLSES
jgi:hypothetical protein